jgi:hypothetical protein
MVATRIEYRGELHCNMVHGPSGTELTTDAPKDNQGRGRKRPMPRCEEFADGCPVHTSLHPEVEVPIHFRRGSSPGVAARRQSEGGADGGAAA